MTQLCGALGLNAGDLVAAPLAVSLVRRALPDSVLETGVATDVLVGELQSSLCRAVGAAQWLPNVCARITGGSALKQLRDRAALDAVGLALAQLQARFGTEPQVRFAQSVLETLTGRSQCVAADELQRSLHAQGEGARDAGLMLMLSVMAQPPNVSGADPEAVLLSAIAELRSEASAATGEVQAEHLRVKPPEEIRASLSADQQRALAALVFELRGLTSSLAAPATEAELVVRLRHWIEGYRQARLLQGPPSGPPALPSVAGAGVTLGAAPGVGVDVVSMLLESLAVLERGSLVAAVRPWLFSAPSNALATGIPGVSPMPASLAGATAETQLALLERVERFLRAPNDDARWRALRSSVLGLGEWTDHLVVDASVGTAFVDTEEGDYGISADLSLGWQTDRWGVVASGAIRAYQTSDDRAYEDLDRLGGGFEAWMGTDPNGLLIFEGRLSAGVLDYASNRFLPSGQFDEVSTLLRGGLLAGVRYEGSRFGAGLWGGGGGQYEYYDSIDFRGRSQDVRDDVGVSLEGRLFARWSFWPRMLAFRATAAGTRFGLTRRRGTVDLTSGATTSARAGWVQVELSGRGHLDFELARFLGFVPALTGGVDWMGRRSGAERESSWVPVLGAGIRRVWF